jgi:hypothetical protein
MNGRHILRLSIGAAAVWIAGGHGLAQDTFDRAPINYRSAQVSDAVSRLRTRIEKGEIALDDDPQHGYLKALLRELQIPVASQVLVFSKTSFQPTRISPRTPRALYFNDEVYVGWVQNSDTLEVSVADVKLGTNFYTLARKSGKPRFVRETDRCLQCHALLQANQIPGHIVRSVYPGPDGTPIYRAGTFRTDQTSPLRERWGGWYVSAAHGSQRHMGNMLVQDPDNLEAAEPGTGASVRDLSAKFDTSRYLSSHSDIVALLVLEHQTRMHNLIIATSFETRRALHYEAEMNRLFERAENYQSDTTKSRIRKSCRRLVEYMLFSGEVQLTEKVTGTSDFASQFAARGPFDSQHRSLRQFDLERRMFKYPCSYLVYSTAFDGLPQVALDEIYRQLYAILTSNSTDDQFAHLTKADRRAILEILAQTKQELPQYWQKACSSAEAEYEIITPEQTKKLKAVRDSYGSIPKLDSLYEDRTHDNGLPYHIYVPGVGGSRTSFQMLKKAGAPNVRYHEYAKQGHVIDDFAYFTEGFMDWLFAQKSH